MGDYVHYIETPDGELHEIRDTNIRDSIAEQYDSTKTYQEGDFAYFDGILKRYENGSWVSRNVSDVVKIFKKNIAFAITLNQEDWDENEITVENDNFIANGYSYIITPSSSDLLAYASCQIYCDDISINGQATFHCDAVPEADLSVNVTRVVL